MALRSLLASWSVLAMVAAGCAASQGGASSEPAAPAKARPAMQFSPPEEPSAQTQTAPAASDSASAAAAASAGPPLDKEGVRRVIKEHLPEILACYEPELKKRPNLHGKLVARFMIAEDGKVASVDMADSKVPSPKVVQCAGKVFEGMVFPRPAAGMQLITYPLDLMPEVTTEWR